MYRDDIWATDDVPYLYHWNGYSWTRQPNGSPTWICRGWDGTVYGVADVMRRNIPQQVFRFNGFNQWLPTQLTIANVGPMNIESRDSGVWWSAAGELKFWPGAVWTDMGGPALATISGAADETVWAVDLNNAILRYNGKTWDNMPGQGRQVSVGRSDLVWSIDPSGNAQRWTGSGWEPHGNPGSALTSIAALTDGAVAGTAPVQQSSGQGQSITRGRIFEWDGSKWAGPGGVADQIAGSSSDLVAGVSRGPNGNRGDLVLGQLVWTVKVENVRFSADSSFPPVLTLSWDPYPGAVDYDARINAPTGNYEATGPRTSISYTLQKGDEYRWTGGWVKALDANGNVLATGVPDNYYYTSPGGTTG
jgi:hypothetical protein